MLFSHDEIAKYLADNFECAWEMVRPAPRVEIDFGDGRKLTRTLMGNIATYFCTSDGGTFDLLPGLVSPNEFLARARLAKLLHDQLAGVMNKHRLVRTTHAVLASEDIRKAGEDATTRMDMSKAMVEDGLKRGLGAMVDAHAESKFEASGDEGLDKDTEFNRKFRYPPAHKLLANRALAAPSELTKTVYKDILHVDLDDPFLGLAPYVLGGEGGRHDN